MRECNTDSGWKQLKRINVVIDWKHQESWKSNTKQELARSARSYFLLLREAVFNEKRTAS